MVYDFCGYATRSGVKCSDGRTIMPDAFRDDDGKKVPLVWNHQHNSPDNVLGHAILENRKDGVYAYATFNDNDVGQRAKELVRHGDISALSIYANKLKETAGKVMHGVIREVSLVLAGANPEAMIDSFVAHSDGEVVEDREQGQFYSGLDGELYHAADDSEDTDQEEDDEEKARRRRIERMRQLRQKAQDDLKDEDQEDSGENEEEAGDEKASDESDATEEPGNNGDEDEEEEDEKVKHADSDDSDDSDEDETVGDILNTFDEKQRIAVMAMLQSATAAAEKKNGAGESDNEEDDEAVEHADSDDSKEDETVGDILNTLTEKQKVVVMAVLETALEAAQNEKPNQDEKNEEDPEMKHNVFDNESATNENTLSHSDEMKIIDMAKDSSIGTLKGAMKAFCDDTAMAHGFDSQSISIMFPEYKDVKTGAPEMLTTDQGWITKVLDKVHKIPMTKVRVRFSDIRDIEDIRAKGYTKGTQKALTDDIAALYRVADAQTVYVRSDLNRDDILDITDFDYVAYMYAVDKMLLNEELATAIMLGDGRAVNNQYKIKEDRIIPIWTDSELFTIHTTVDFAAARTQLQGTNTNAYFGENFIYAEAFVEALMNARVDAKNSGQADLFISPRALNKMLLARDRNGRRIYNTLEELRSAMNVREIITAEQFEGKTRTVTETVPDPENEGQTITQTVTKRLLGILTKMENYDLGANKGGEITHFTDFDLDFNKEKSLLETRVSGMQVRPLSSVVLEEIVDDD